MSCIWGAGVELELLLAGEETGAARSGLPLTQRELSCAGIQGAMSGPFPGKGRGIAGAATPGLAGPQLQPLQHPRAQQATTHRGFPCLCPLDGASSQGWEAASSFDGSFARLDGQVIARLHAYCCARMCLNETIIIHEQLRA